MTRVPNWLLQRSVIDPDGIALIEGEEQWTFGRLQSEARSMATGLAQAGVGPGHHVVILMQNQAKYAVLIHALMKLQAVAVPLNTRLAAIELQARLADAGARFLVHDESHTASARGSSVPDQVLLPIATVSNPGEGEINLIETIDLDDVQAIIYTSGTTGKAKGVMLTYGNQLWSAVASALNLRIHPSDCWLSCLPFFHVGGLSILLKSVIYGMPVLLYRKFDALAVNLALDEGKATIVSLVPTMLRNMVDARAGARFPPSLRAVLLGGAPAPDSLLSVCAGMRVPVLTTYGLTEAASQVATLPLGDRGNRPGCAGKALFGTTIEVRLEGGPAPPHQVGEIVVRGPTVMAGYWNQSEATAESLREGWLHTGDLGSMDEEGYLWITDRRGDLIISGGENVYPAEVEGVLVSHPFVEEAAVFGVDDDRWGQRPAAAVRLKKNVEVSPEEIQRFCGERLAPYKVPLWVSVVDEMPTGTGGKLMRSALSALLRPRG